MPSAFPLVRNVAALRGDQTFDVLVIGGGIYGAWTAYDAAQRGLSVALVERNDWASGTSSSSSKLIHGGCATSNTMNSSLCGIRSASGACYRRSRRNSFGR